MLLYHGVGVEYRQAWIFFNDPETVSVAHYLELEDHSAKYETEGVWIDSDDPKLFTKLEKELKRRVPEKDWYVN